MPDENRFYLLVRYFHDTKRWSEVFGRCDRYSVMGERYAHIEKGAADCDLKILDFDNDPKLNLRAAINKALDELNE